MHYILIYRLEDWLVSSVSSISVDDKLLSKSSPVKGLNTSRNVKSSDGIWRNSSGDFVCLTCYILLYYTLQIDDQEPKRSHISVVCQGIFIGIRCFIVWVFLTGLLLICRYDVYIFHV